MTLRIASGRLVYLIAAVALSVPGYAQEAGRAPAPPEPSPLAAKLETVAVVSDQAQIKAGDKVVATVEKGRMFGVLSRRGDQFEIQVCVGTQILRGSLAVSHVKFLTDADIDLAAEWLKMSKDLNPKLDVAGTRAKLDALVERVAAAAVVGKTPRDKARLIGIQLFEREGFSPHPDVDLIGVDRLLDLRRGPCFTLSLLYLCIGKKLGVPFYWVPAPEHAFVRFDDGRERFSIETTERGMLHASDDYLRAHLGAQLFGQAGGIHLGTLPTPRASGVLLGGWGTALEQGGRPAEACEKFAKAVEIDTRHAAAYYNWGIALRDMGRPAEACEKFAKAVQINPQYARAYYNWGYALGLRGKRAEAIEKLDNAAELDPALKPRVEDLRKELRGKK
jgi:tetratricopeptide (TPR) repeat protein